ncbi:MAG: hypothetical protein A4E28_02630 [Methanocella sp. PtaU1.Bin125]|nr:MAG: hypothetical protein A4E28_02630 [Methanocella sp. PtaU1.Bin125]
MPPQDIEKADTTLYIIDRQDRSARIACTSGKISISMKQSIDRDVLALILLSLSKVDSTIVYEYETLCKYDDINRFRQDDYIVISYSKSDGGYKTIFNVPFSRKKALRRLAFGVVDRLKAGDVDMSILWDGNQSKIDQLFEELGSGEHWKLQVIEANKED